MITGFNRIAKNIKDINQDSFSSKIKPDELRGCHATI
jgi:pyruvate/2-oxoglutarate dehydrogenase complex dihydrolipoamide acyltransferase (E2) component